MKSTEELHQGFFTLMKASAEIHRALFAGDQRSDIPSDQLMNTMNPIFDLETPRHNSWLPIFINYGYVRYLMRDYRRWKRGDSHFMSFIQAPVTEDETKWVSEFKEKVFVQFSEVIEYLLENYRISNELAYALVYQLRRMRYGYERIYGKELIANANFQEARKRALFGDTEDLFQVVNDLNPVRDTLKDNLNWKTAYDELEATLIFESAWGRSTLVADLLE